MDSKLFEEIQKRLQAKRNKICLQGFEDETSFGSHTLKSFIEEFLTKLTLKYNTVFVDKKSLYCHPAPRRSTGDIFRLCSYYFTNVTLEEVLTCLAHLDKEKKISYFYCLQTKSRVWMEYKYWSTHTVNPFKYREPDEYGIPIETITELSNLKY